jgi:hypothetical protein
VRVISAVAHCIPTEGVVGSNSGQFFIRSCSRYDVLYWWSWSCRWGETMSLNCCHQWAHRLFPRWYMNMENHGGIMMST